MTGRMSIVLITGALAGLPVLASASGVARSLLRTSMLASPTTLPKTV